MSIIQSFFAVLVAVSVCPNILFAQTDIEALEEAAVRNAVGAVSDSVIRFETIGGASRVDGAIASNGPSSGVVVSKDGYIVSASFHFAHKPSNIFAYLPNGERATAEIVGRDHSRKIVLLKIQSGYEFQVPSAATPEDVSVGSTVVAVGRVLDSKTPSVSTGIVSAKNRIWSRAIQTDAKISPANFGGPLLNLNGQVIGILVPMSPDDDSELGGTEWYDSGIGFAVSFTNILERVDSLKTGKPLRPGVAGISLKGSDIFADPATVAFCSGSSPAGKAGIKRGDQVVEINGIPIRRQAEFKHALGPLYEGDVAQFIVVRKQKRLSFDVKLAGEIEPFVAPGIGIEVDKKLLVQRVLPDSSAMAAGIEVGDRVLQFDGNHLTQREDLRLKIAASKIDSEVQLRIQRGDKKRTISIQIRTLDAALNSARSPPDAVASKTAKVIQVKIADVANQCFAVVPDVVKDGPPPGLLVWIPGPGKLNRETIKATWLEATSAANVIVLIPESTDANRWTPGEMDIIVNSVDTMAKKLNFDRTRVAVGGFKSGGTMAGLLAFSQRDLFRGLILIDSNLSQRTQNVMTSPVEPMMILFGTSSSPDKKQLATIERLTKARFPLHSELKPNQSGISSWCDDILRWASSVNRM